MEELATIGLLRWLRGGGWKWVAGALTALIAAASIAWLSHSLSKARGELSDAQATIAAREGEIALLRQARAADAASERVRVVYRDRVVKEATERQDKTNEALKANPDWANTPVPPAVADSLR
jgi:hypothetical protein